MGPPFSHVTTAVLVNVPAVNVCTGMVSVIVAPAASVAATQCSVSVPLHEPNVVFE